ncbi:MAG: branched-chain amino acid ABC transporter permease [Firmicutes bacterium]|jgi:branched-chain amino acid transport system permease protein|nr:branched-chain amino acid ABC transporter permease [Bacillota bacterium]
MPKKDRNALLALLFIVLFVAPIVLNDPYVTFVLNNMTVNIVLVMALNFVLGFAGQVFLGTVGFFAVGCYATALLTTKAGLTFWQAVPVTVLTTAALAFVLGLPTLKLRGFYLALMSLGFIIVVGDVLKNWTSLTNGVWGVMGIPRPVIAGHAIDTNVEFYYMALVIALALVVFAVLIEDSRFGRAFKVVRDDELAGEMLGIDPLRTKLLAFVMCGVYTGVAGSLFASFQRFISPEIYTFDYNSLFMCMLVVGGLSSVPGSVLGASLLTTLTELLRFMREKYLTVYAILILITLIYQPGGLVMALRNAYYWVLVRLPRAGKAASTR